MVIEEKKKNVYITLKLNEKVIINNIGKRERIVVENLKNVISITHIRNNKTNKKQFDLCNLSLTNKD